MKLDAFAIIAILLLAGCHLLAGGSRSKKKDLPASAPAPVIERTVGSFRPPPAPDLPVKRGPAPLVYMVESATSIRVVDMDSGATVASAFAAAHSIVSIDESAGVRVGADQLVKGPLPAGKTYGIYLENQSENEFDSQFIRPGR